MTRNATLLAKADLALADLQADGGELLPEQGATFIRKLIASPTLTRRCRTVEMTASSRKINKIGFGTRILRKATQGVELTEAQRSKPTTAQIELNTKEQIAEVHLPYNVLEDNIERATAANNEASNTGPGGLRQTILDLIAERAALDIEELGLLSDVDFTSADPDEQDFLTQTDGWLKRVRDTGNVFDAAGAPVSKTLFKEGLKSLPVQYQRNKAALNHFIAVNQETEYRDTLADRGTGLGDASLVGSAPVGAFGSPVTPVALMPEGDGLLTDPLNLIFGIQRQISMEYDKDIKKRVYIIVLTLRCDFQVEETEAAVAYENIGY